jgi:hypothetical protein
MALKLRRILFGTVIALLVYTGSVAFLVYFLPYHEVLRIVGAETRRPVSTSKSDITTHDVFYIFAEDLETKNPRVFRNEDTRLGFPWYFKFNSPELQAVAQSLADERGTALVTYYGWRIKFFSLVPNLTNIERAPPDEEPPIPWLNLGFAAAVIGGTALLGFWIRGVWTQRR